MDEKEFKDILDILKQAGREAYACDTPFPLDQAETQNIPPTCTIQMVCALN